MDMFNWVDRVIHGEKKALPILTYPAADLLFITIKELVDSSNYQALGIQMDGGFAEYVRVPEAAVRGGNVTRLPENVTFEEAAINEALSCACNGSERCAIRPGDDGRRTDASVRTGSGG